LVQLATCIAAYTKPRGLVGLSGILVDQVWFYCCLQILFLYNQNCAATGEASVAPWIRLILCLAFLKQGDGQIWVLPIIPAWGFLLCCTFWLSYLCPAHTHTRCQFQAVPGANVNSFWTLLLLLICFFQTNFVLIPVHGGGLQVDRVQEVYSPFLEEISVSYDNGWAFVTGRKKLLL
jgi:hypothetical protein